IQRNGTAGQRPVGAGHGGEIAGGVTIVEALVIENAVGQRGVVARDGESAKVEELAGVGVGRIGRYDEREGAVGGRGESGELCDLRAVVGRVERGPLRGRAGERVARHAGVAHAVARGREGEVVGARRIKAGEQQRRRGRTGVIERVLHRGRRKVADGGGYAAAVGREEVARELQRESAGGLRLIIDESDG